MAPRVTVTKRVGRASNFWLTGNALATKRRRRQLERKWKRSGTEDDRFRYRLACRQANNAINLARQQHHQNILELEETKHDPKRKWKFIKGLLHSSPVKPETTELEDANLSVSFGTFFQNKIDTLRNRILSSVNPFIHDIAFSGDLLNAFRPVAESEVEKLLKRASNKSNSLDFLPTSLLRECSEVFVPIITRLANLAFVEGKFPDNLKCAVVTPLIKKPNLNRDDPANFRSISNLNTIGKLLERLILNRLQPHLAKSPCFNRYQSAYRTGHSTETALLRITDNVLRAIDNKRATILVELDLSAA